MILSYEIFLTESKISEMLLESKLVLSPSLIKILELIPNNDKVGQELKRFINNDIDIENLTQNYIDISDSKEKLTFIQDRRASSLKQVEKYTVIDRNKVLTYSSLNDYLFEMLNFDKNKQERYLPNIGEEVSLISESPNKSGSKIYALVKTNDGNLFVINKTGLMLTLIKDPAVWKNYRNPINVGRLVRGILQKSNIKFTDSEIEIFVNNYKSIYDIAHNDIFLQFDIVKGDKIPYWYDGDKYENGGGTLNNSCMSNVDSRFFNIYSSNPDKVSLIILYADGGRLENKKYFNTKIKGRAILWDVKINGENAKFLDRIYTVHDSDVNLFKEYAKTNGWWYKVTQNSDPDESISNGITTKIDPSIDCHEINTSHIYYPYLDTLYYVNIDDEGGSLYNYYNDDINGEARDTNGNII